MRAMTLGALLGIPDLDLDVLWGKDTPVLLVQDLVIDTDPSPSVVVSTGKLVFPDPSRRLRPLAPNVAVVPVTKQGNPFSGMVTVGRATNNDIVVPSRYVSKIHAWFSLLGEKQWHLTDNESTNKTFLDGWELEPRDARPVVSGSAITFGTVACVFLTPQGLLDALDLLREIQFNPLDDDQSGEDTARFRVDG